MVSKIAKTYSVKDGKVTRTVTFEESLPSQSSASYSSNAPIKYGFFDKLLDSEGMKQVLDCVENTNIFVDFLDCIESKSSSPTVKHTDAPVRYNLIDNVGAVLGMIKETGLDKFCKYCDFMKTIGLASPTVNHTPAKYGFFDNDEMEQALGCIEKIKDTAPGKQGFIDYIKQVVAFIEPISSSPAVKYNTEKPLSSKSDIEKSFKDNKEEILKALEDESNWNRTTDYEGWLKDILKGFGSRETYSSAPVKYAMNKDLINEINEFNKILDMIKEIKNAAHDRHLDNKPSHYAQIGTHEWLDEWNRGIGKGWKEMEIEKEWNRGNGERGNREWERERDAREMEERDRDWENNDRYQYSPTAEPTDAPIYYHSEVVF